MIEELPLLSQVIILTVTNLELWARFRGKNIEGLARGGINDVGRILWIIEFFKLNSVDELLYYHNKKYYYDLGDWLKAFTKMNKDIEFQIALHPMKMNFDFYNLYGTDFKDRWLGDICEIY